MTPEDIAQITAIVTTAVAAAEQRINANVTSTVAAAEERASGRLERTMEALTANLSEVRKELITRLDTLDRRTDRTEVNVNAILMQLSGISRSLTVGEQLSSQFAATQGAQQHAIDQLAQRITKIERELHPDQH